MVAAVSTYMLESYMFTKYDNWKCQLQFIVEYLEPELSPEVAVENPFKSIEESLIEVMQSINAETGEPEDKTYSLFIKWG